MKVYLDCYPCFIRGTLSATRMATDDVELQYQAMQQVLITLHSLDPAAIPPVIGNAVHRVVREETGNPDPYLEDKQASTREALGLYPRLKAIVEAAEDPVDMALRLSIAGNIIDPAVLENVDVQHSIDHVLATTYAIDDRAALRAALDAAEWVLYLGDNAGETVFDRLLIETLDMPVHYAVKGAPILNDATMDDAIQAGLDAVTELISTGSQAPGTILSDCTPAFRELFDAAPLIIAKGQANYQTLKTEGPRVFFLLQAKCPCVTGDLNVPLKSIILMQG